MNRRPRIALAAALLLALSASGSPLRAQVVPGPVDPSSCAAASACLSCAARPECGWCANEGVCTNASPGAAPCARWLTDAGVCKAPTERNGGASMAPPATAPPPAPPAPPAPPSPAPSDPQANAAVQSHATVRAAVGVPPLQWSAQLAGVATDWAQQLCARSSGGRAVLQHRPNNSYGENIYWMGGAPTPPGVEVAVQSWAEERRFYNQGSGQCAGGVCGHYTQLVWRDSRSVGCGAATCGVGTFWVCNYDPPGNYTGRRPY